MKKQMRQSDIYELIATGHQPSIRGCTYGCTSIIGPLVVQFHDESYPSYFSIATKDDRLQTIKLINKKLKEIQSND